MDGPNRITTAQGEDAKREGEGEDAKRLRCTQVSIHDPDPIGAIVSGLGAGSSSAVTFELVLLFISSDADFDALVTAAHRRLTARHIVACTTAGEIGEKGYEDDQIVAMALMPESFRTSCYLVERLDQIAPQDEIDHLIRCRVALADAAPDHAAEFAFLTIDGMSRREDAVTAALSTGLGGMPLFGGSAGDGQRFGRTFVALDGQIHENAAVVTLVRSRCPIRVFSLDHLTPTDTKMVVTEADPQNRIVRQINAEPAAREYARIVGKMPDQLDQFTFAAHPVVVQLGSRHHVRAIQRVNEHGELVFFSAIDEGMVLTLADSGEMAAHLDSELARLSRHGAPEMILGCDCLLRRIEAEQHQIGPAVSEVLRRHNVRGFATYGEQVGALHVNHTMTGVAFYPPDSDTPK
ncbi:FIST N-terminal domain-containing protein [Phaeobacter sp. J2-8]|uniref:FIST N-terminal domain-containing protein n=1 Tax=Phaeobacter sp. J2-8 TaxID=2931394 RepID=UPI001FD15B1E|nr:FIST N-terminal domain-containing protein [Phaeobacter sp. J2-8]MCJ7872377.1 FIST C-terminal domain-containing protein [Phaeobacter sp. J2-8]